jgi:hypothetical protein
MARIALGLLCLAVLLGGTGCTWTQTYNDFPPGVATDHGHHHHDHDHDMPVAD